jgi:hypothetical protein
MGDDMYHVRTVVRSDELPDFKRDFIGFRCASYSWEVLDEFSVQNTPNEP